LDFLASGKLPSSSLGILSSSQMKELINELNGATISFSRFSTDHGSQRRLDSRQRSGYDLAGHPISALSAANEYPPPNN